MGVHTYATRLFRILYTLPFHIKGAQSSDMVSLGTI